MINMLFSHAYMRFERGNGFNNVIKIVEAISPHVKILIDSGAFTNMTLIKNNPKYTPITIDEYITACKTYSEFADEYIMLDVIRHPSESLDNYYKMMDSGLKPIPVYVPDMDYVDVEKMMLNSNYRICTGVVPDLVEDLHIRTEGKAKTHMLGYARTPKVFGINGTTFDSSSFMFGARYGDVSIYHPIKGVVSGRFKEKKSIPMLMKLCNEFNVTNFKARLKVKAFRTGDKSFSNIVSIKAFIDMALDAKNYGKEYYFAVSTPKWVCSITAVLSHYTDLDYDNIVDTFEELRSEWNRDIPSACYKINTKIKESYDKINSNKSDS